MEDSNGWRTQGLEDSNGWRTPQVKGEHEWRTSGVGGLMGWRRFFAISSAYPQISSNFSQFLLQIPNFPLIFPNFFCMSSIFLLIFLNFLRISPFFLQLSSPPTEYFTFSSSLPHSQLHIPCFPPTSHSPTQTLPIFPRLLTCTAMDPGYL